MRVPAMVNPRSVRITVGVVVDIAAIATTFLRDDSAIVPQAARTGVLVVRRVNGPAQRLALQLPPRRGAQDAFKKATISRAEGGQLQAPVRPQSRLDYPLNQNTSRLGRCCSPNADIAPMIAASHGSRSSVSRWYRVSIACGSSHTNHDT